MKRFLCTNSLKNCGLLKSVLIMLLLSMLCVLAQTAAQTANDSMSWLSFAIMPFLVLFNALPLFLIMSVVYCITNRVWAGFLFASVPFFVLLAVNYFKVYFRAETLSAFDFSLAGEAVNIMGGYKFPFPLAVIAAFMILTAGFVFVLRNVTNKKEALKNRIILLIICILIGVLSYFTVYNGVGVYSKLSSFANEYNDVSVAANKGFIFTFLSHINKYKYNPPEGYSYERVMETTAGVPSEATPAEQPVNIIAVMSEAFFDMEACENIEWYEGLNPTPNLNRLRDDSYWGYISVPGFAGSTASTEFEFLTGINISLIDSSMPVVYKTHITKTVYGLPRLLKDCGYRTEAMHPGDEWFYDRKAVYPSLGCDSAEFKGDYEYTNEDLIHNYVSDKVTAKKIEKNYENYLQSDNKNGYFSFTVTIQNHGAYSAGKTETVRLKKPSDISEAEYNALCNYANGLYDADAMLGEICAYFEEAEDPTVVVFFGDHLPFFDSEGKCLTAIGNDVISQTREARENRYNTPYIIHGNKAFKAYAKNNGLTVSNGRGDNISSSFLASRLLNYAFITPSGYFKAVDSISRKIPIIHISGGQYDADWNDEAVKAADDYKRLAYWALRKYK